MSFTDGKPRVVELLALSDSDAYALKPETADALNGLRCQAQLALEATRPPPAQR